MPDRRTLRRNLPAWLDIRMTQREYRANLEGLNIFFGAIVGVVMTDIGQVDALVFAAVLVAIASFVVTIIYVSSSERRIVYALVAAAALVAFNHLVGQDGAKLGLNVANIQQRVFPTLAVWLAMTVLVEFAPRRRSPSDPA